jgi:hypothetical protein
MPAARATTPPDSRVLLVGWDGVDWKIASPPHQRDQTADAHLLRFPSTPRQKINFVGVQPILIHRQ